jgi:serine/threonine-protein kinase
MAPSNETLPFSGHEMPALAEPIAFRFEHAFADGRWPDIDDYLPPAGPGREEALIDLVHIEFERRLKAGQPARVETYLERYPELARDPAVVLDLVTAEYQHRRRCEPGLGVGEYQARFPHLADRLAALPEPTLLDQADPLRDTPTRQESSASSTAALSLPGYELLGELGRGGMGLVLKGHDQQMDRDVAVKLLREKFRHEPHIAQRFVREARISGGLQHPGIVPVYQLGEFPDGRPFFTMKVVEGRTLAGLLNDRPSSQQDQARFLQIFEQVCQALAYAHAQGVIHRDLTPSNIMVGAFGEVQVMDWGLAKVLPGAGGAAEESGGAPAEEAGPRTGVVGTPAYMAPEQARGELELIDARADVFGLGGILCHILTEQPPYTGEDVLRQAAASDLTGAFARLDDTDADTELVALCRECLTPEREGRPRDAGAVAARVTAYQAAVQEEFRRAELERAAAEARATEEGRTRRVAEAKAAVERRARRLTVGLATALLVLVVGGGGGAWFWQHQRQKVDTEAALAMKEAWLLLDQAKTAPLLDAGKFREAMVAARNAEAVARTGASKDVQEQTAALVETVKQEADAAERDHQLLVALLDVCGPHEGPTIREDNKGQVVALAEFSADKQFADAFRAWDATFDVDVLATEEAAARLRRRPPAVVMQMIAALDEWASERRQDTTLKRKDPVAWQRRWQRVAELAAALDDSGDSKRRELRELLGSGDLERERALGSLSTALRPVPVPFDAGPGEGHQRLRGRAEEIDATREPVLGLLTLVRALQEAGDEHHAERLLWSAVLARPQEVALQHALGRLLTGQKRWREAAECWAAVQALRPGTGVALAYARLNSGRIENGLTLLKQLVAEHPGNPWMHVCLGDALSRQGRYREAAMAYQDALRCKPDYPEAHNNLGSALRRQGYVREAEDAYLKAIHHNPDFLTAHNNLGHVRFEQGRYKEAEEGYREVIRLNPDMPEAHNNLGSALWGQERYPQAEKAYRKAIALKPDYPEAHTNLGLVLREQAQFAEALVFLRRGQSLGSKTPGWQYRSAEWIRQCEYFLYLDRNLPAILRGDRVPAGARERTELAYFCQRYRSLYVTATRYYFDSFDIDPKQVTDLRAPHRSNAAYAAALAAAGQGEDTRLLPDKVVVMVVVMLRRQALNWLRAELSKYSEQAGRDTAAKQFVLDRLVHWQQDSELASVRDRQPLDQLPDDERRSWQSFWIDVADLLKRIEENR